MNIDFYGLFEFGDEDGVKQFAFAHQFTHEAEAAALQAKIGNTSSTASTFDIGGSGIVEDWIGQMRGDIEEITPNMADWLQRHNDLHQAMLTYLGANETGSISDISMVDFSDAGQMYDWLQRHQALHDLEQQALGITA
ncbi:MAG TPA: hypothetical protein VF764_02685 [Steroidobacteraceae bacterium]